MLNLGMDLESTKIFVQKMCAINTLSENYELILMENIVKMYDDMEAEKLKQEKESWKRQQKIVSFV